MPEQNMYFENYVMLNNNMNENVVYLVPYVDETYHKMLYQNKMYSFENKILLRFQ